MAWYASAAAFLRSSCSLTAGNACVCVRLVFRDILSFGLLCCVRVHPQGFVVFVYASCVWCLGDLRVRACPVPDLPECRSSSVWLAAGA